MFPLETQEPIDSNISGLSGQRSGRDGPVFKITNKQAPPSPPQTHTYGPAPGMIFQMYKDPISLSCTAAATETDTLHKPRKSLCAPSARQLVTIGNAVRLLCSEIHNSFMEKD